MNEKGEFIYNGKFCTVWYSDFNFLLSVYSDSERTVLENAATLFPVKKFSENQKRIAFHVANLHVLPNLYN